MSATKTSSPSNIREPSASGLASLATDLECIQCYSCLRNCAVYQMTRRSSFHLETNGRALAREPPERAARSDQNLPAIANVKRCACREHVAPPFRHRASTSNFWPSGKGRGRFGCGVARKAWLYQQHNTAIPRKLRLVHRMVQREPQEGSARALRMTLEPRQRNSKKNNNT